MAWLEKRQGCAPGDVDCFGPTGEYWTLFDTEWQFLGFHAVLAVLVGGALLAVLLARRRRRGAPHVAIAVGASLAVALGVFLLAAYVAPVRVVY